MIQNDPEVRKIRQEGKQAADAALDDARGEMKCGNCGMKSPRADCPRCDADDNDDNDDDSTRRERRTAVEEMAERFKQQNRT